MKQQEKAEQSRRHIIQAALKEFSAEGYQGCTIDKLCCQHQLSRGKVFYHFKNKEEIFISCVEYCCKQQRKAVGDKLRQAKGTAEENLALCQQAMFAFGRENPQAHQILSLAIEFPPPGLEGRLAEILTPAKEELYQFIAANVSRLPLRPGVQARQVMTMLEIFLDYISVKNKKQWTKSCREITEIAEIVEEQQKEFEFLIAMLLHGVVQ